MLVKLLPTMKKSLPILWKKFRHRPLEIYSLIKIISSLYELGLNTHASKVNELEDFDLFSNRGMELE